MKKLMLMVGMAAALGMLNGCQTDSNNYNPPMPVYQPPMVGSPAAPATGLAALIINAQQANSALMQHYSWSSRVELMANGAVQDIRIDVVTFGMGGQLQRTLINDQASPLPSGFIRRRIAENKRQEMEGYLDGLRGLLDQYAMPTPGQVATMVSQAQISAPDANGLLNLTGSNWLFAGDIYGLWFQAATRQIHRIQISTTYQGNIVQMTASYETLKSGLTHLQYAEVDVPAKGLRLMEHNFDYNSNN